MSDLIRNEVIEAQSGHSNTYGAPTALYPPTWSKFTYFLFLLVGIAVAFLFVAEMSRKEVVRGRLVSEYSEARVFSRIDGVLEDLKFEEGEQVEKGETLAVVSTDTSLADGSRFSEKSRAAINAELNSLNARKAALVEDTNIATRSANRQISSYRAMLNVTNEQFDTTLTRLEIAIKRETEGMNFIREGLITEPDLNNRRDTRLALEANTQQLREKQIQLEAQIAKLEDQKRSLLSAMQIRDLELDQAIARLEQQDLQMEASAARNIPAPMTGYVTAVLAKSADRVTPQKPILTISPEQNRLYAELFVPSRGIGFMEIGQTVKIQYDSFPYQKFGVGTGTITNISDVALLPSELEIMSQSPETMYLVEVELAEQTINSPRGQLNLQSGMQLSGVIVLEDRKLIEWVIAPFVRK